MSKGEKYFREQREEAQKKHLDKKKQVREKEEEKVAFMKKKKKKIKEDAMNENREDRLKFLEKEYPGLYPKTHRKGIKKEVKDEVWNRDNGECVDCSSQKDLEFDHIIPYSKGGADSVKNLQILCRSCNRKKSNKIG